MLNESEIPTLSGKEMEAYLLKDHTCTNCKIYLRDIRVYLDYMTEEKAAVATYQDIMQYVDYLRKQYQNPRTINRMLYGVKAWYHWLMADRKKEMTTLAGTDVERCQRTGNPVTRLIYFIRIRTVDGAERAV
jgi:site-specific recombinase XerD